jgi:hypothetical protein
MKKGIKSFMVLALAVIMVFCMTACSDEDDVKSAAKTFLDRCEAGDFEAASKLCSSSAASSLGISNAKTSMQSRFASTFRMASGSNITDYSQATQDAYNDFIDYTLKKLVESYELNDDYDDKEKTITAKVKVLDTSSATITQYQTEVTNLVTNYYKKHMSSLTKVYQNGGTTAVQKKVMNALGPKMFELAKTDFIDKFSTKEQTWKLTFEKNDSGKWVVKSASAS